MRIESFVLRQDCGSQVLSKFPYGAEVLNVESVPTHTDAAGNVTNLSLVLWVKFDPSERTHDKGILTVEGDSEEDIDLDLYPVYIGSYLAAGEYTGSRVTRHVFMEN